MSAGPPSRPKFIMIGWGVAAPHIGEIVDLRSFFFPAFCWASAQPTPSPRVPHIIHQSTRFRPRMCLWGVSSIHLIPFGSYSPKTPHFGDSNGDFQHKRLRAYLGKEETYNDAWWRKMRISARHTMCNKKNYGMGSYQRSNLQKFVSKANLLPNSK